ncbi:hypothetical protein L226DRAFT_272022 [Lentinus tigrinus ALCF2SS1-7]|uniref:Uncharacterized protein n=1 Tax=Lentinus tigrinus ALCF2SS1-6 TaxID=1328759 RepID=A0A5C2SAG4_9APHY|nr:hypothetical protein L227DRAFT_96946 [Lentinus tigrinus ALCF2SS1-6]RPD69542.1 hypothetical protein L226DRAFT_272022 [Lentinus tigrinus ALCF2SS1-7]
MWNPVNNASRRAPPLSSSRSSCLHRFVLRPQSPVYCRDPILPNMPQCAFTSGDPPSQCTSTTFKKSKYCKAHSDEFHEIKSKYKHAEEQVEIMGRSLVNASQIYRTPLEERGQVEDAVNMILWYVVNMDQEAHWRRKQDAKFYGGENERHHARLAELKKLRSDGIALLKIFRARYDTLAARDKEGQPPEEARKVAEDTRSLWDAIRRQWHIHLHTFCDHGDDEAAIAKQVDEEMGLLPEV